MTLPEDARVRRLSDVGRALVSELDVERVLSRLLQEARELTGARYAALGVLDESRHQLERFITVGIDEAGRRAIGELPRGRGVLGVLIEDPRPLRLDDVGQHPQSFGFPPGHPPMHSFLGVPVTIRGEAWGNLYLTDKADAERFTDADEEAVSLLAVWAGTAIENARLYQRSEHRREELERAVESLRASRDIANAISSTEDLDGVLELIVKRGRALVQARAVLIMLRDGDELAVVARAGYANAAPGLRLPIAGSSSGHVLREGVAARIDDAELQLQVAPEVLGVPGAQTALLVPMLRRGSAIGVLAAFDRGGDAEPFTDDDRQLLQGFAASAANAVSIKQSVEADRLRSAIEAAEAERRRWARELHDQTLQALAALRVSMSAALRRGDPDGLQATLETAVSDVAAEIDNLRGIIADLRPSLLDDLGLRPALEAMIDRRREHGLAIESSLELAGDDGGRVYAPELETTVYRLVQEALTNIVKHARATRVRVTVRERDRELLVEVADDGGGFDVQDSPTGFGLGGMRERVYLAGGSLAITSDATGTTVSARLPVRSAPSGPAPA